MGKKALGDIKEKIDSIIKARKEEFRESLERETHTYTVEQEETEKQIVSQLKYVRAFSPLTDTEYAEKISTAVRVYISTVKTNLESASKAKFQGNSITINTSTGKRKRNIFRLIRDTRKEPLETLRKTLAEELFANYRTSEGFYLNYSKLSNAELLEYTSKSAKYRKQSKKEGNFSATGIDSATKYTLLEESLFGYFTNRKNIKRDQNNIPVRAQGGLQLGHVKDTAVNKFVLSDIAEKIIDGTIRKELNTLGVRVALVSAFKRTSANQYIIELGTKNFEIEVSLFEEGSRNNQGDSSTEKKELNDAIKNITSILYQELSKENWADQKGSASYKEAVIAAVTNKAISDFAKIKNAKTKAKKVRADTKSSKLIANIAGKVISEAVPSNRKGKTIPAPNVTKPERTQDRKPQQTWSSLLPILNAKLTPRVIANMRFPSLVNRTGTFANSAKVINIEQTREGFPTFVFDYERDPYNVFDKTQGRAPWNTPERDPRALVDKSVREIVREMAVGRFYTRRA